ncbi:MAG: thioesterase family protein, partial [Tahibacter sp.]
GIEQERLRTDNSILFVIRDLSIGFLKPARLDDQLSVTVTLSDRRSASLVFTQQIVRGADSAILINARVRAACINANTFRPCPIPEGLFVEISNT